MSKTQMGKDRIKEGGFSNFSSCTNNFTVILFQFSTRGVFFARSLASNFHPEDNV